MRSRIRTWHCRHCDDGACFCLAGVVQGLAREGLDVLDGVTVPCTMIWGRQDRSHRYTDPESLRTCVPGANVVVFDGCGHFPDLEAPERYADILLRQVAEHAIVRAALLTDRRSGAPATQVRSRRGRGEFHFCRTSFMLTTKRNNRKASP